MAWVVVSCAATRRRSQRMNAFVLESKNVSQVPLALETFETLDHC